MIINRNSWHYKLVVGASPTYRDFPNNSCQYISAVAVALVLIAAFIGTMGVALGVTVGNLLAWGFAMVTAGHYITPAEGAVFTILLMLVGGLFATLMWSKRLIAKASERRATKAQTEPPPIPGFVSQAWAGFRGKYCTPIKIVM